MRECRICGCTDDDPCVFESGPCSWVEPDLCSACAEHDEDPFAGEVEDGFYQDTRSGLWLPV